jgi:DHA2 family multidrug resistance protein
MLQRGVDARLLIGLGLAIAGAATVWMGNLNLMAAPSNILWPRVVQSCGAGLMFVPLSTIAFRFLPREESGNASALYALVRNEGSSIGVALVTTLLTRSTQMHQAMLVSHVTPYDPAATSTLDRLAHLGTSADPTAGPAVAMHMVYNTVLQQASMLAYMDQFRRFGFLVIVIVPLVLLLRKAQVDPNAPKEAVH